MAFGLNRVELIGRLGADVTVNHLTSGGRVANLSIATDESYINKQSGEKVDKTEWHRVVTFQDGLIDMFENHGVGGSIPPLGTISPLISIFVWLTSAVSDTCWQDRIILRST